LVIESNTYTAKPFGKPPAPPTSFSIGATNETRHRFCSQVTLAFVYTKIMFNEQQPRNSRFQHLLGLAQLTIIITRS